MQKEKLHGYFLFSIRVSAFRLQKSAVFGKELSFLSRYDKLNNKDLIIVGGGVS